MDDPNDMIPQEDTRDWRTRAVDGMFPERGGLLPSKHQPSLPERLADATPQKQEAEDGDYAQ